MPGWLPFEVRRRYALAALDGREGAAEGDVQAIADKVLSEAPEFARLLVARHVRSMVRADLAARKRKKPETEKQARKARERKRLAEECAALSVDGWTLREIGAAKGVSHQTVANLVAEWLMSADAAVSRQKAAVKTVPDLTAGFDRGRNVIPLRRPA
jgi:hypothetical protein